MANFFRSSAQTTARDQTSQLLSTCTLVNKLYLWLCTYESHYPERTLSVQVERSRHNHCMMKAFQHDFQFFPLPCRGRARGLATRLAFDGQSANASDSPGMATPSVRLKRPIRYARSVVKRVSDVLKQVWFMASCCSEENVCKLTCWTYYDYQVFASRTKVQCITLMFT